MNTFDPKTADRSQPPAEVAAVAAGMGGASVETIGVSDQHGLRLARQRLRMRFRKLGDLRWISHRDLARTFERWFRRAGLPLRMSEGFHPKARISFPSALALGIESLAEVVEFELEAVQPVEETVAQLAACAPPGLEIAELVELDPRERKAQVRTFTYAVDVPASRQAQVAEGARTLNESTAHWIRRAGREEPVDVKAGVDLLEMHDGQLRFRLFADPNGSVRPREVLEALGAADLEYDGVWLQRVAVELAS